MLFLISMAEVQDQKWIDDLVAQKIDPETIALVKKMAENGECCGNKTISTSHPHDLSGVALAKTESEDPLLPGNNTTTQPSQPTLYIFMSYSVPKQVWQDLWATQHVHPFQFVIRGIPNNSFKDLAAKVTDYKCPVMIHPDLFIKYNITQVPAFVFVEKDKHKGAYGNVSLEHVLRTNLNESSLR